MTEIDLDIVLEHFTNKSKTWLKETDASTGDDPIPSHRALTAMLGYGLGSEVAVQLHLLNKVANTPMQKLFGYALLGVSYSSGDKVVIVTKEQSFSFLEIRHRILTIAPSMKSKNTWVDYELYLMHMEGYNEEGIEVGPLSRLFVLCDEVDSYEKDNKQIKREQQNDKKLREQGCEVMRFSKSEIWADPMNCANKAYDYMYMQLREQLLSAKQAD